MKQAIRITTKVVTTDYLDGQLDEFKRENSGRFDTIDKKFIQVDQKIEGVVIYMNARFDEVNIGLDRIELLITAMLKDQHARIMLLEENQKNFITKEDRNTV